MKKSKLKSLSALLALALASGAAVASSTAGDSFYTFYSTVLAWSTGSLGTGLSITMLLMGAGIGVAKNSPMPALSGVAGGAFMHWGPDIIKNMMGFSGASA